MNTSQIKNFAIQSRNILKAGVLNRILAFGFDVNGNLKVDRPVKIQGGTIFMGQLREEGFFDAWIALEERIAKHSVKEVCEEAAYTWFNRLVAIRIMQKNGFIEPVMQYANEETRIPVIVDQARSGRLSLSMTASEQEKLEDMLRDPTKTNDQFNLLISVFCKSNPVIYNCFGGIEKYIGLLLPDNILAQGGFIDLLNKTTYLTEDDYKQSELIGWLYQYYISERKDEVFNGFKKGEKAEADDIPAATQIFTPNWIVKYMVQNTLGRIYLDNNPYSDLKDRMKYLVKTNEAAPEEAILKVDDMEEYTLIDPACGSGHILVEAFDLLYTMYQEEAYPTKAAITSILTKNIIGLDLDTRAKQLATFALLMKACQNDPTFLDCKVMPRVLDMPEPFIYRGGTMQDFLSHYFLGGSTKAIEETTKAFELMKQADNLGSIMKFDISPETRLTIERSTAEWEKHDFINPDIEAAIPSMKVILALTDKYASVVANPPYMGSSNMNTQLSDYVKGHYSMGKSDLCTVFMLVQKLRTRENGFYANIMPPSWMFLSAFEGMRLSIIKTQSISSLLHLSRGVFGADFGSVSCVIQNRENRTAKGTYFRLIERTFQEFDQKHLDLLFTKTLQDHNFKYFFADYSKDIEDITHSDNGARIYYENVSQAQFNKIPGSPLGYWLNERVISSFDNPKISSYGEPRSGIMTGNSPRFVRLFHEVSSKSIGFEMSKSEDIRQSGRKWFPIVAGGSVRKWYGNLDSVVNLYNDGEEIQKSVKNYRLREPKYYFKQSITWPKICSGLTTFRLCPSGVLFGDSGLNLFVDNYERYLGLLNSKVATFLLKVINPTFNNQVSDIGNIPVANLMGLNKDLISSCVHISQDDWDAHETSWNFQKNELIRAQSLCRQNVASMDMLSDDEIEVFKKSTPFDDHKIDHCLRAYKNDWERKFYQLHSNEEELNRKIIDIYGLQNELTPEVPLEQITILQQDEKSIVNNSIVWHDDAIIKQFISYAIGCWMGRYRLDKEGLSIAHYPSDEEVCSYDYDGRRFEIDDDAIIPLMGRDTPFEDDNALQKLDNFVKIVFGEDNLTENLNCIDHALGKSLEDYLVKDFWKDHKKMYQNRPIYWLFSSKKGAFQVLVYMHRMNPYTVEKIRTKYLLPYIEYLKGKIDADEARGADLSTSERKNLTKMRVALEECTEYHDRLHDVAIKAIDFDLDDGVVANYAKFGDVLAKIK